MAENFSAKTDSAARTFNQRGEQVLRGRRWRYTSGAGIVPPALRVEIRVLA
jgi:hypothetical protein